MIPYGRQEISQADIDAVVAVLRSDFLTQGPTVPAFEKAVASYCGVQHAIAVNSATSALHIACLALGVGKGDVVWTTPITFVASANCALYCGATVDFVDIDPLTYNLSVDRLAEKLEQAAQTGKLPKVVIPVHLCGQACDMVAIYALGQKYGFKIIEDASHAIGGKYKNEPIGNCKYSNITVFSFHPVKIITTAEGGLLTTRDSGIAQKLVDLRSHGITRDPAKLIHQDQGAWYYEQHSLGFNYRMTELQAALGVSQMNELDRFVSRRHVLVNRYEQGLFGLPIVKPWQHPESYSSFHLYVIQIAKGTSFNRRELFDWLQKSGVLANVHYIPIHLQPFYLQMGFKSGDFPNAEAYYENTISLPLYVGLTEYDQDYVITMLKEYYR